MARSHTNSKQRGRPVDVRIPSISKSSNRKMTNAVTEDDLSITDLVDSSFLNMSSCTFDVIVDDKRHHHEDTHEEDEEDKSGGGRGRREHGRRYDRRGSHSSQRRRHQQRRSRSSQRRQSRKNAKELVDSALEIATSPTTKTPSRDQKKKRGSKGTIASPVLNTSMSSVSSAHSRRSTGSHRSQRSSQDSKLVSWHLHEAQKHRKNTRPAGARTIRKTNGTKLATLSSLYSKPPSTPTSDDCAATAITTKSNASGLSLASVYSERTCDESINSLESFNSSKDHNPAVPSVVPIPDDLIVSSSMSIQRRPDCSRYMISREKYIQQRRSSLTRKMNVGASMDKYLDKPMKVQ